jgi:hypothetical protein
MQIVLEGLVGSGELWLDIMKIICGDTPNHPASSMCDLMCHRMPYTPQLGFKERTYVDIQDRDFDFPKERAYFRHMDVFDFLQECEVDYDVMICSDGLEHCTFEQGKELLRLMYLNSDKQIIFTPLGELSVTNDDHPDAHKSGWKPQDFPGWTSIVFPNFHPKLNSGAFFTFDCSEEEKQRIYNEIKIKYAFYDKD